MRERMIKKYEQLLKTKPKNVLLWNGTKCKLT